MTMDAMPTAPAHAKPARRDLLWVLVLILACGLLEVWASWLSIGAVSGFPKLGRMTTGWILPVTTEAYWSAALFAWLAVPAGPKSAAFAKWSAAAMFVLSLAGQESDHLLAAAGRAVPPVGVVGFVTALPLISVALIAILIHLRQTDRDDAAAAGRRETEAAHAAAEEAAAADERTALRAELAAARDALEAAESARADAESRAERQAELEAAIEAAREARTAAEEALETARDSAADAERQAAEAEARAETLRRRLDRQKPNGTRTKAPNASRTKAPNDAEVPDDFDARTEALGIYMANPKITGKALGEAVGLGERWGQKRRAEFAASNAGPDNASAPGPAGPA